MATDHRHLDSSIVNTLPVHREFVIAMTSTALEKSQPEQITEYALAVLEGHLREMTFMEQVLLQYGFIFERFEEESSEGGIYFSFTAIEDDVYEFYSNKGIYTN